MTEIFVEHNGVEALVRPAGDIVGGNAGELRTALRAAFADGARDLTLDFSAVAMVDSSGLGLLIAAHNSAKKAGGRIAVVNASREIMGLFQSMRINQHFPVSGD